ncbi:MAG: glycine--tRNA ligase subunit beta [Steroidobacteraceae bacterium]
MTKNLLVELFVEELPPKALAMLGRAFADSIGLHLIRRRLLPSGEELTMTVFSSPRRLSVLIQNVSEKGRDNPELIKLMPVAVGLSAEEKATPALLKKLQTLNLDESVVPQLRKTVDGKTETLFLERLVSGMTLAEGLQEALDEAIRSLPIPKAMSYQLADGWSTVKFVRPAHGLVALHGTEIVPVSALGLDAGRTTHGHRFEASKSVIELKDADSYATQLENEGAVIADFAARRAEIVNQLQAAANKENLQPITDEALLDEVTALVERPNVLTCQFEKAFLDVPAECLILTMKANQKYFPLLDAAGKLTNKFLVISNIRPADPSKVIQGNERVIRPRLADAKFFFDEDRKRSLESRLPKLDKIVYHNKLGTLGDRLERLAKLARRELATVISTTLGIDTDTLSRNANLAAKLAKTDLVSDMVGEFPELQGIMGRYYALADGLSAEIAEAIREHYLPRGAGDELPLTPTGMAVALADKLDTITGVFAIDQKPTGTRDPFGVRRAAIGLLRIMIERQLPLDLMGLIEQTVQLQPVIAKSGTSAEIYDYIMERLRGYYLEGETKLNVTTEMFDAVLANRPASPLDFDHRLRALESFLKLSDAQVLAAANKRINNILKKAESDFGDEVDTELFAEDAERNLYKQLQLAEQDTAPLFAASNYQDALTRLATLRPAVNHFFESVMVMADDLAVRNNRLALLLRLRNVFLHVADLSRLPG